MAKDNNNVRREKRKRSKPRYASNAKFERYIHKMVPLIDRQFRENGASKASISTGALAIADSNIKNVYQDLAKEAIQLMVSDQRRTLAEQDIMFAVLKCLKGEVARDAVSEGQKAVYTYVAKARRR